MNGRFIIGYALLALLIAVPLFVGVRYYQRQRKFKIRQKGRGKAKSGGRKSAN
jgi:hypothetical protein